MMTKKTLLVLKEYLELTVKEKMDFLAQIRKIETMNSAVRSDYEKTLISLANG
jgi:hypothetical protein